MRVALEEDRDHLLASLDDLERERQAGDLEEADYLALKEDYTARAAAVLRALEGIPDRGADASGAPEPAEDARPATVTVVSTSRRSRWRPVLVGVTLLGLAAGAGAVVARSAGERLPGDAATGSIEATGPAGGVADDLARARDLIGEGKTLDAIKVYDAVLGTDPMQPEALAYRGWLLRLAGRAAQNTALIDKGMEYIERAVAADPTYPDAHFFRAFVLYQDRHDPAGAVPELRTFLAGNPPKEMVPVVEDLLRRALAETQATDPPDPRLSSK
jgi:tetratricopeptide (TPR) repeat protein